MNSRASSPTTYVQYDETGTAHTKQEVLSKLKSGALRYVSMISTGRHIRLLSRETAVVHGSEEDEVEQGGKRCFIRYIYMDAVVKRNGKWQIVASQLARPVEIR
ncbi:MAG: nuclear transport factor 2 family protein [Candidatus Sulfotelmatobacter sp.]